jgi:hypothetical protein
MTALPPPRAPGSPRGMHADALPTCAVAAIVTAAIAADFRIF